MADITDDLRVALKAPAQRLVLYIGSSIGNFEPQAAVQLLGGLHRAMAPGDALLLGTDMVKPASILLPAYDDAAGVTAAFNKNVLARINRELGADFDLEMFAHEARWNAAQSRIEMHLRSRLSQMVRIDLLRLRLRFADGETIHTENSYKYTPQMVQQMLQQAGFRRERTWYDPRHWFAVHLARRA